MIVDASAAVAVLNGEVCQDLLVEKMRDATWLGITPISALEVVMILARRYSDPAPQVQAFLAQMRIDIHPIDAEQTRLAQQAFLAFGKGRHKARLNLSDCFSYAAAKALDAPLLFVGNDFARTDIRAA